MESFPANVRSSDEPLSFSLLLHLNRHYAHSFRPSLSHLSVVTRRRAIKEYYSLCVQHMLEQIQGDFGVTHLLG